MHHITIKRLAALSKEHQRYETDKAHILQAVASQDSPKMKLRMLLGASKVHRTAASEGISIPNIRRYLEQSEHDPSVSSDLLQEWQMTLQKTLDIPSYKYEHASLFGQLVMEWLGKAPASPTSSEGAEPLENIGRKEMYDQRREWESIVFAEGSKSDPVAIENYLSSIFDSALPVQKIVKSPLDTLKEAMGSFQPGQLCKDTLKVCIAGLLKIDLLSETKRKTLLEFSNNSLILSEMVDVLNMEINALESWSWGEEAVPVDLRRSLNGKYRVYMDEEITQALFLHTSSV